MEKVEKNAGPFLVLVVEGNVEAPDRRTQEMGSRIAATTESKQNEVFFVVALNSFARSSLSSLMTGYGSTATFEPDQIRHPMTLDMPELEGFTALMKIVRDDRLRGTESADGKPDPRKPRKAMVAITTADFIKSFLHYYFSTVADRPEAPNLDEFVAYGTSFVLDMTTHEVKLLQT
jgi:hypothetical protein